MQKMIKTSVVLLGIVFLAGCGQKPVSQTQPAVQTPVVQEPVQPVNQTPATQQPIFGTSEQQAFEEGRCDKFIDYSGGGVTANTKSQCIKQKALRENNLELCQTIAADYEKHGCIEQIAVQRKDKKLCYLLSEVNGCLSSVAIESKDVAICEEIKNDNEKKRCRIEVTDKCDISAKEDCEAKSGCYWKNAGGKLGPNYSCCPKADMENSPQRCNIMVD